MAGPYQINIRVVDQSQADPTSVQPGTKRSGPLKMPSTVEFGKIQNVAMVELTKGLAKKTASAVLGKVGAYTENHLRQKKINYGIKLASYAGAIALNPVYGVAYTALDIGNDVIDYQIELQKKNIQADYLKTLSYKTRATNSRYKGVRG